MVNTYVYQKTKGVRSVKALKYQENQPMSQVSEICCYDTFPGFD